MDITTGFIVAVLVLIFGGDLWLLVTKDYRATVSATLLRLGQRFPAIVAGIFFCLGHVFWVNEAAVIEAVEKAKAECHAAMEKKDGR